MAENSEIHPLRVLFNEKYVRRGFPPREGIAGHNGHGKAGGDLDATMAEAEDEEAEIAGPRRPGGGNGFADGEDFVYGDYVGDVNYQVQELAAIEGLPEGQIYEERGRLERQAHAQLMEIGDPPRLYLLPHPRPDPLYMQVAKFPARPIFFKRPLLVVLDLNGTLLVRKNRASSFTPRPRLEHFLQYVLDNHKVVIWSSAKPGNVHKMVDNLIPAHQRQQIIKILDRTHLNLGPHYNKKVQVYKQLSWLWADTEIQNPHQPQFGGYRWDQTNTVLIDDSVEKAAAEPYNLLKIDEFSLTQDAMEVDVLGQVAAYLEHVRWCDNVSSMMREQPYRTSLDEGAEKFDWARLGVNEG